MRLGGRFDAVTLCAVIAAVAVGSGVCLRADDWPEWRGKGRLGVWNETDLVDKFPDGGLPVAWRTPINSGYAGPSIADGRVFTIDSRRVKGNQAIERALALDEKTGSILWKQEWDADYNGLQLVYAIGPRATPTVDGDRVYVLGTMGRLLALDVRTGRILWQKDFAKDFNTPLPSWGMSGAPLVDGDRLISLVGGEPNAKVVAFNKFTGQEIWRSLSSDSEPGYSQPVIVEGGGTRQLIIFHATAIDGLDPLTGKVYWEVPNNVEMGMSIATPVQSGPYLFITSQWSGAVMLELDAMKPTVKIAWRAAGDTERDAQSLDTINSVINTPVIQGDYVYGVDAYGVLRCLHLKTGKQVWETKDLLKERAQFGTAFFVRNGDHYFINNDRGELVLAKLSPEGYAEIGRTMLIEPTHPYVRRRQLPFVLWSHAAYANKHVIIRNDKEIVSFSLAKES